MRSSTLLPHLLCNRIEGLPTLASSSLALPVSFPQVSAQPSAAPADLLAPSLAITEPGVVSDPCPSLAHDTVFSNENQPPAATPARNS